MSTGERIYVQELTEKIQQLESERQEMIDALIPVAEEIRLKIGNERYLNEESINPESHAGQISLTVKEALNILTALRNAGVTEDE